MRVLVVGLVVLVAGCGGGNAACLDYTDAAKACFEEAEAAGLDVDVDNSDPEGFCDSFADTEDDVWDCNTKAYNGGDCTTDEGLAAILEEADACGPVQ